MGRVLKNLYVESKKGFFGMLYPESGFLEYQKKFLVIPGCRDKSLLAQYRQGNLYKIQKPLSEYYGELLEDLHFRVKQNDPYVYVRVSDGEAYFLKGRLVGNGPKRHYTKAAALGVNYLQQFSAGLLECDSRHIEMYKNNRREFFKLFKRDIFSEIPFECLYALAASRDIFKLPYKIGLIGSERKLEIIKNLIQHQEYRDYLGRENFQDYIGIPERGSSNDVENLAKSIGSRLRPDIDIYLVGIGIAKLAILPKLKSHSKAVFLDLGAGLSALAGMINTNRPYFADWVNYRLKNYDYSGIDQMDFVESPELNIEYL